MPLGLMPGMSYEEKTTLLEPGDSLLLHTDGLAEAHAPDREMFGFPRLRRSWWRADGSGEALIDRLLAELARFTGPGWEQEDDITLVTLERAAPGGGGPAVPEGGRLADFTVPSEPGVERPAMPSGWRRGEPLALPTTGWRGSRRPWPRRR